MNVTAFFSALAFGGMGIVLTATAQVRATPDYTQWFDFPELQLPGETAAFDHFAVRPSDSIPASLYDDNHEVQSAWLDRANFDVKQSAHVSSDPFVQNFESAFHPEVYHLGKHATLSCSISTAIARKNPLCLLNCTFLNLSW